MSGLGVVDPALVDAGVGAGDEDHAADEVTAGERDGSLCRMFRLLLGPLALGAAIGAAFVASTNGHAAMAAGAVLLAVLGFTAEALHAEWRGRIPPRGVAGVAGFACLMWAPLAALLSWFVPFAVWLLAVAFAYGVARVPMRETTAGRAWTRASERFALRRERLTRHYRWRVALAALPWMTYLFSLSFLMAGVTAFALGTAGGAAGSPETAALGLLVGAFALGIGVLVSLPSFLALAGLGLTPFVRGPYLRLVLALRGEDRDPPTGCGATLLGMFLDLVFLAVGFVWSGSTLIGSAFPGGGSTASLVLLPLLLGALGVRLLAGDAQLISDRPAIWRDPGALLHLGLFQAGVVLWGFGVPVLIAAVGLLAAFATKVPLAWVGLGGLVFALGMGRLGAATVLRLHLHRLEVIEALAS